MQEEMRTGNTEEKYEKEYISRPKLLLAPDRVRLATY